MPKITIIDGNSLLFRAYFATAYPGVEIMRSQDGTPTNAIFAFSNMINKILSNLKNDEGIMVAFDAGKDTFRKEQLESYKANRKPTPEDLVKQFPIARDFLRALGIFQFEEHGFEGDDIAGTVAKLAEKEGYQVTVYTSDRDFLQLVDSNITVNIIRKGMSDIVAMTPEVVKETYGFEPLQIIDYKGLRGDTSDNLPGIKGIGEKTAVKLIQEYGSFDNIIAHASEIKGKIGEAIINDQDSGRLSRDLAIIKTDVPLPFNIKDTIYQGYEFTAISEFCQKYELKQFMSKIVQKWKKVELENTEIEVKKVSSLKDIKEEKEIGIALDYEDDNYSLGLIYGLAVASDKGVYYISLEDLKNDEFAKALLNDKNVKKYCFDYKAIKVALAKNDITISGLYFDLLVASYLVDSSLNKNDVTVVMNIYGIDISTSGEGLSLFTNDDPQKTGKIAFFSWKLYDRVASELEKTDSLKLFQDLEVPLEDTLADMEIEGFPIDSKVLDDFGDVYKKKADELSKEIYELAGTTFNLASPKQIGEILFDKLGLSANKKLSTSVDSLKEIQDEHPIVGKILEYRKYFKLITTYVEGLKNHIHEDGKIHAKFNQALTTTGRLSSSEPNLQNISVRDEEGKLIRKAFYYEDDNYEILSLDYSQIELRVLASLSNCPALKEIFLSGEDIHAATAKKLFNLQNEPTSLQRRKAKTVNFGVVYGISDWGLADQLGISNKEAREIINSFYSSFPEVATFFQRIVNDAVKDGYVSTMLGRRRYLRELHDANYQVRESAKRAAMNAPVQGTAADLIKYAMIKVHQALLDNKLETKMICQIHDELIFKVPKAEKEKAYQLIKDIMENALSIDVPLEVDGGFGRTWYDAK
ncbi:MAG: DNA polymerase I [Bacilli bacterium]|nr:DNA polymerase I [Bacilli bacterium]